MMSEMDDGAQHDAGRVESTSWRSRLWPALALLLGCAVMLAGGWATGAPHAVGREPAIAVLVPAPGPDGLEALGLLDRLRRPNVPEIRWLGGALIEIPGASGYQLWRRAITGRIDPQADAVDLLERGDIQVYGDWYDPADAARDREHLANARASLDAATDRELGAVVLLSCSRQAVDLAAGACRETFLEAVTLLEDAARRGGTGVLLGIPVRGFPQIGTVWAIGPNIQEGVDFRFRMIDLAPTMLRLLGRPVPPILDGGPSYDMTRFEQLFHRPLRWVGGGT
jgi:hypothetical protein